MKQAIIFGSAPVADWSFLSLYRTEDDLIICADGGLRAAQENGLSPDWYVGDSDSGGTTGNYPADLLPSEKDVTDLDMAVSRALQQGCDSIVLCGCTGGRQDHHFSAVGQLERIHRAGISGMILDPCNEIRILAPGTTTVPETPAYRYFGIVPLDEMMCNVTIQGAKYEASHIDLYRYSSLAISNNLIPGQRCTVQVGKGIGLLIRSN